MKEGIGFTATINIITIFIVVTFGFLSATLLYYKAYKVNNMISDSIEKYEGYNSLAQTEINQQLATMGYITGSHCTKKQIGDNGVVTENKSGYDYCVKYKKKSNGNYYNYEIITYLRIDIPVVDLALNLPVKTTTENIYYFSEG